MAYLPYLFLTFSSSKIPPLDIEKRIYEYIAMCSVVYDDKDLYELGRQAVNKLNKRRTARPEKVIHRPDGYTLYDKEKPIPYYSYDNNVKAYKYCLMGDLFVPSRIDTLRVRTVVHNDRKALRELEKYYRKIGYDLGIAIYYKALLCRDGNGDLAERLYQVLQPYFYDRPELENAAREALIRAAMCDNNKRAKELCDSLGYSFCDYKVR